MATTPDPHETVREFLSQELADLDLDLAYSDFLSRAYPEFTEETVEQMHAEGWTFLVAELYRIAQEFKK